MGRNSWQSRWVLLEPWICLCEEFPNTTRRKHTCGKHKPGGRWAQHPRRHQRAGVQAPGLLQILASCQGRQRKATQGSELNRLGHTPWSEVLASDGLQSGSGLVRLLCPVGSWLPYFVKVQAKIFAQHNRPMSHISEGSQCVDLWDECLLGCTKDVVMG